MLCDFERFSGLSRQTVFQPIRTRTRTRTPLDVHFGCNLNVNFRVNFQCQGLPSSLWN